MLERKIWFEPEDAFRTLGLDASEDKTSLDETPDVAYKEDPEHVRRNSTGNRNHSWIEFFILEQVRDVARGNVVFSPFSSIYVLLL